MKKIEESQVYDELAKVIDMEIGMDIVSLGLIYGVQVDAKNNVVIDMTLTVPSCPLAGMITGQAQHRVQQMEDVGDVHVNLVFDPPWTPDRMKNPRNESV